MAFSARSSATAARSRSAAATAALFVPGGLDGGGEPSTPAAYDATVTDHDTDP